MGRPLSERPHAWTERLKWWLGEAARLGADGMPGPADIALLLETIVGAWPLDLALDDAVGRAAFVQRLAGWQRKALREAKLQTDWSNPDLAYEAAARGLLQRLLVDDAGAALRADLFTFVEQIAPAGAINGLAQTLLRLTVPGVPDLYEGTEIWDFSLADPDNRRPVDFARRQQMLGARTSPDWRNGAIKQALIARALGLRSALPELFSKGSYEPIAVQGRLAGHVIAFLRRHEADAVLVVVPRLPGGLRRLPRQLAFDPYELGDTTLALPTGLQLADALDGNEPVDGQNAALQHLWRRWPVAFFSTRRPFAEQGLPIT